MACNDIQGITYSCLSNTGGVKQVDIANYDALLSYDLDTDGSILTATWSVAPVQFQFNKNTSSIEEEATINLENGVTFYKQTVNLVIPRREASKRAKILLLADGQPNLLLVVKDQNDISWLVGLENGANLTAMKDQSGVKKDDANGYTLTFLAEEPKMAPEYLSLPYQV